MDWVLVHGQGSGTARVLIHGQGSGTAREVARCRPHKKSPTGDPPSPAGPLGFCVKAHESE